MERSKRFIAAVGSGYAVVVATAIYSLVSVPMALTYLGREGLGVATTVLLINAFGQVLQFGVGPSLARFVVDCLQEAHPKRLGALLKLGMVVGVAQAAVLSLIALSGVGWLSLVFSIPETFSAQFQSTLTASLLAVAFGFLFVPIHQLLYAGQRIDLVNYISIGTQGLSTAVLLFCLSGNLQIHSYAVAVWVQTISGTVLAVYFSRKLGILPKLGGCPTDWSTLPKLARFSGNVMVASLGLQVIAIAPALVINRILGAASMGDWAVGTRLMQLGAQLTGRIPNAAEPTLWEIFAKGDKSRCAVRLRHTAQIATTIGVLTGAMVLATNGNFVKLWSNTKVSWPMINDAMGACIIIVSALAATLCMLPGITKHLGRMRYIYPAEGLIVLGLLCIPNVVTALDAVLAAMLASMLVVRLSYGVIRAMNDLNESLKTLVKSMSGPILFGLVAFPTALLVRLVLTDNASWLVLVACTLVGLVFNAGLAYTISLPQELKEETRQFIASKFNTMRRT